MWPDRVSNPGSLALESDALPTALRGSAVCVCLCVRGYLYSYASGVKFYFEKIIAIFPGAKTTTCTGKSFHTFRVAKQTFITTYMYQKIL